ncbi:hypothetical protein DICSQDRAFT_173321 [Dichomitus squalens LYAD-421 SS1]|uniref:Uncharacterized protein n=1 Tax=Dichomitus squalens (strain LYAD-421) TaxID=732165 RepID=R7SQ83_DICSQ|nr:uncharacterized protein DICSQDRAFT_173321 [Dichomitus squalens LYAD-421 SS1]EJF58093.1 hypothetical protein DICSQDRAFT_173321 [Dichomitus squalens LYAD-421 SS1]
MSDNNHPDVSAHSADYSPRLSRASFYDPSPASVVNGAAVTGVATATNVSTTSDPTTDNSATGALSNPDQGPFDSGTAGPSPSHRSLGARPSFVRHCPSSTNCGAYTKKTGKQLVLLLIDR